MPEVFHLFPQLDEYLRRMVWKFYFESPRIHVIHEPAAPAYDPEVIELTCTTFDATFNLPIPSYLHYNIDHESRQIALGLKPKRERIQRLLKPVATPSVFHAQWPTDPVELGHNPPTDGPPIDIDWDNDLFYICSPESGLPFASLRRRGDWVGKIQKLAIAQPFETPTTALNRPSPAAPRALENVRHFRFNATILEDTLSAFGSLREMSVVCLPPASLSMTDAQDEEYDVSSDGFVRDESGFVPFGDYLKQKSGVENRRLGRNTTDTTRIYLALQERLTAMGKLTGISLKKCIDIDGKQLPDGSYHRRKRGSLSRPSNATSVDDAGFSFNVTEAS